jgi:hypothetical protein
MKRFVQANKNEPRGLTRSRYYCVLCEFETSEVFTGMCVVVNNDDNIIEGYDSSHFE